MGSKTTAPWRRVLVVLFAVTGVLAANVGVAGAIWIRGASDISRTANDERVCDDTITLSANLTHQTASFESAYPTYVPDIGVSPYPGSAESIPLFASQSDAANASSSTPVVTVVVALTLTAIEPNFYEFDGESTVATPAGYVDGDVLWAAGFDSSLSPIQIPLTVGDAIYGCSSAVEPLGFGVLTWFDLISIDPPFPYLILFDARAVDPASLTIAADNGTPSTVNHLWSLWGIGIAWIDVGAAGVDCDSSSLVLSGDDGASRTFEGTRPIVPVGPGC